MKEILRSNNPVLISRIRALLAGEGINFFILDFNASIIEGSIGALPQRLSVADDEVAEAERLIREEGLGTCLLSSTSGDSR